MAHCEGYKYGKKPGTYVGVNFQWLETAELLFCCRQALVEVEPQVADILVLSHTSRRYRPRLRMPRYVYFAPYR